MIENTLNLDEIQIQRPFFNQNTFQTRYSFRKLKVKSPLYSTKNYLKKNYKPSRTCLKRFALDRLPVVNLLRNYEIKSNLFKDLIGGLTIGVVQIPQSLAYSLMAGLPPVNGNYCYLYQ